jgi:hypothetical protein
MKLRIIQWNIKINSKTDGIAEFLLSKLEGNTVVGLQEVSETAYEKISAIYDVITHSACICEHREN